MRVVEVTPQSARRYQIELDRDESYALIFHLAEARKRSGIVAQLCADLEEARGDFRVSDSTDTTREPQ